MNTKLVSMLLNTKSLIVLSVAALVLGGSLGAAFAVGLNPGGGSGGGSALSEDDRVQFQQEAKDWGFISRYGRTGRIQEVKENTVMVATPKGALRARVGDNTSIRESKRNGAFLSLQGLSTGALITVNGEPGENGTIDAAEILVIPEGEGGFDIRPQSEAGPALLPVFP